jgi:hypothetical protein
VQRLTGPVAVPTLYLGTSFGIGYCRRVGCCDVRDAGRSACLGPSSRRGTAGCSTPAGDFDPFILSCTAVWLSVDLPVCLLVYTPGGPTNFQICFLLFFGQYPKVSNLLIRGERSSFGAQRGAGNKPPLFHCQWILHESQGLFKKWRSDNCVIN